VFGSSLVDYIVWASRGFADPLGFALLFAGILFVVPTRDATTPESGRAFFGALLLAMAAFCRPNFVLAGGTMVLAGVLMALAHKQFGRALAVLLGFATLAISPLHNYIFGSSTIPFTDNVAHVDLLKVSPREYFLAVGELARMEFAGDHLHRAIVQIASWWSGAHRIPAAIPIHAAAVLILAYVGFLGRRFDPWLRTVALATLLQHGVAACYLNNARYHVGTWLLTSLVATAWLQVQGLAWLKPATRDRWAQRAGFRHVKSWLARLQEAFGLRDPQPV
jgi:hypothetical protein